MLVKHALKMEAKCPVNDLKDHYDVVVECNRVLKVEDIIEATAKYKDQAKFQEDITQELANSLNAKVTTTGYHSGVKTICEC